VVGRHHRHHPRLQERGVLKQNINPEIIIILLSTIFLLLVIGAVSLVESYLLSESSI